MTSRQAPQTELRCKEFERKGMLIKVRCRGSLRDCCEAPHAAIREGGRCCKAMPVPVVKSPRPQFVHPRRRGCGNIAVAPSAPPTAADSERDACQIRGGLRVLPLRPMPKKRRRLLATQRARRAYSSCLAKTTLVETKAARATARAARTRISEEDHGHVRVGTEIVRGPCQTI